MDKAWRGFTGTKWLDEVNVRQFIQDNYDSYDGDASNSGACLKNFKSRNALREEY